MCKYFLSGIMLIICSSALAISAEEDAQQIMQKSQDVMTLAGSESISTLTISDGKGNTRIRKFSSAQKSDPTNKVTKMIMKFLDPADVKGTGILTFDYDNKDDDMWLYMPALRKVRRIVSNEKSKGFMGSEFSNADITKPILTDFNYKNLGTESIGSTDCWKIEAVPLNDDVKNSSGYSKKIIWVGKLDYTARKTEFYNLDGVLAKVLTTNEVKLLDEKNKKYQPVDISMENKLNGRSSRFVMEKIIFNPNVKDEYFTTDYLEK
ncbi:MAG: outer membrane lipoprotein-sorting protein [Fibrobacter sp.]|nr:outer membrane lipoprotein-sorting protein [Fibrobacter sp.]